MNDFDIAKQAFELFQKVSTAQRNRIMGWVTQALGGEQQKSTTEVFQSSPRISDAQTKPKRKYKKRSVNRSTPPRTDMIRYVVTQVVLDYFKNNPASTSSELKSYAASVYPDMPSAHTSLLSSVHSLWKRGFLVRTGASGEYRYSVAEGADHDRS